MYMAIDQYGQTYHGLEHPRKDLLERLGRSHAEKMYRDTLDGRTVCTGYVTQRLLSFRFMPTGCLKSVRLICPLL